MVVLAYFLSIVSLILSGSMLLRLKWNPAGKFVWLLHWAAGALSPVLAVVAALGAALGAIYAAPVALVAGLVAAGISLYYILRVTVAQPGFEAVLGTDWLSRIGPTQAKRLLPRRWNLVLPKTGEPRLQANLPFWTIPGTERKLLCDVWQPPYGVPASGLAFVYMHGSAWWFLDKDLGTRPFFRQLAAQGHVVMDVAYRLCPEVDIFGMIGDVKRAVAWMKAHAAEYGVDPERVVLGGGSSGGHVALLAAYTPRHPRLNPPDLDGADLSVCAVVSYYGPTDMRACYMHLGHHLLPHVAPIPIGQPGAATMKKGFDVVGRIDTLLGGYLDEVPEMFALASPVAHVDESCPPTLLIQGTLDAITPVEATCELHRRLVECGVQAVNIVYPMTNHAFDLMLPSINPATHASLYYTERFLAVVG